MKVLFYIFFQFINVILAYPNVENPNFHEFRVNIEKIWNQSQHEEYKPLFDTATIEEAMGLTVYKVPKPTGIANKKRKRADEKINGQFERNEDDSNLYKFSIPIAWTQNELELQILLKKSGQVRIINCNSTIFYRCLNGWFGKPEHVFS
jgi:hypothetical protein